MMQKICHLFDPLLLASCPQRYRCPNYRERAEPKPSDDSEAIWADAVARGGQPEDDEEDYHQEVHAEGGSAKMASDLDRRLPLLRAKRDLRFCDVETIAAFSKSVDPFSGPPHFADLPPFTRKPPDFQHEPIPLLLSHRPFKNPRLVEDKGGARKTKGSVCV